MIVLNIGIVMFEGVDELDVVGPFEVFAWAAIKRDGFANVFTVAETAELVTGHKGMRVMPDHSFASAPPLDVILVPGGRGVTAQTTNPAMLGYIRDQAARCQWITSVCTGAFLLVAAGPAAGKRVTTYWGLAHQLRELPGAGDVRADVRWARDGNVVTSAGVSAGIDMSFWLLGQLVDAEFSRSIQKVIEYAPWPPYAGDI
jgi:transcriptional regulator GlxA family with amidase domain